MALEEIFALIRPGARVYLPGAAAEITPILDGLKRFRSAAHFLGVWLPGINRFDFDGLSAESIFPVGPGIKLRTLGYRRAWTWLAEDAKIDLAFIHVSTPDSDGRCSLGIAADFANAAARRARTVVGVLNPNMPPTKGGSFMHDSFDRVIELEFPLLEIKKAAPDETGQAIASHVASLIEDGDTIEYGLGKIPEMCVAALKHHRRLKLYSGMISEALWPLLESGAFESTIAGIALGSAAFYRAIAKDPRCSFHPVCLTHDVQRIGAIPKFKAINSALEIDLFGQVNVETLDGRAVSGVGGLHEFLEGACHSRGGFGIVALPSTAQGGKSSRIVPRFAKGTPISVSRHHVQMVVTEYGIADLRGLDGAARAAALIAIAAPQFRDQLQAESST